MNLIPVIDLQGGQVVRAVRGERARYAPIVSRLAAGSDPLVLAPALLAAAGSRVLYVADLDALQGRPPQSALLHALLQALPACTLWVDAGFADRDAAGHLCQAMGAAGTRLRPVYGSESLAGPAQARAALADKEHAILSLDRLGDRNLDPAGCWSDTAHWPCEVIVMTLERVGSQQGPDLSTLQSLQQRAPHQRFTGAGGIRNAADLARARSAGAAAWLVASALHDGALGMGSLEMGSSLKMGSGLAN